MDVCVNLVQVITVQTITEITNRSKVNEQIQRKISSAKEILKETSRKTKEVIFEYVNLI